MKELTLEQFKKKMLGTDKLYFVATQHYSNANKIYALTPKEVSWDDIDYPDLLRCYCVYSNYWHAHAKLCKILKEAENDT